MKHEKNAQHTLKRESFAEEKKKKCPKNRWKKDLGINFRDPHQERLLAKINFFKQDENYDVFIILIKN